LSSLPLLIVVRRSLEYPFSQFNSLPSFEMPPFVWWKQKKKIRCKSEIEKDANNQ